MDEPKVDRVVKDLVDDYDRRDGSLSRSDVERLLEKRDLTIDEGADVYRQLEALGITLEDEVESLDFGPSRNLAELKEADPELIGRYYQLDARLRGMKTPLLRAEEEVELGRRMEIGRRARAELQTGVVVSNEHNTAIKRADRARETMVVANLRLVLHIARGFIGLSDLSPEDLFQEGNIGLMRAADKYDHTLGYKFSTYATWWIRQAIMRALADRGATIRLPVHVHEDVLRLKRAYKLLSQINPERRPSIPALADELCWSSDKVHFLQQASALLPASLDESVPGLDDVALIETIASSEESPEDYVDRMLLKHRIDNLLGELTDRERKILSLRFGLDGHGDGATLDAIGKQFIVTRERIRQIEAKALKKLRLPRRAELLRPFFNEQVGLQTPNIDEAGLASPEERPKVNAQEEKEK